MKAGYKRLLLIPFLALMACKSSGTLIFDQLIFPTASSEPVVLGEWHNSLSKAKKVADDNGIPMVVVYVDQTCGYCHHLDLQMITDIFEQYQKDRRLVMVYGRDQDTADNKAIHDYARNDSGNFPYMVVYWKGVAQRFTPRYAYAAKPETGAPQVIAKIESYISSYVTPPSTPPATDAFDPADDTEGSATRLAMSKVAQTSTPHYLNASDTADWFQFTNLVADTEYRVWVSGLTQSGATNLQASFYLGSSATPLTNMPLASLTTAFPYTAESTNKLLLKVSRNADTNATVSYTLNYREWVPCSISFVTNAVSVSEAVAQLSVVLQRTGDQAATSATLTFSNGTAKAGSDYVATPITATWTAGGSDLRTVTVPIIKDTVWEGNETFTIQLTPDPSTASGGLYTQQAVTLIENTLPKPGSIGYTYYGPADNKKALTSLTRIAVHEGDDLTLWLSRIGGTNLAASAIFTWSDGSAAPDPLNWASQEGGEKKTDVIVPEQEGYQAARTVYLNFTTTGAAATAGKTRATLTVIDAAYVSSLAAYVAANPAIPFKTTSDAWFQTQGDSATLRCAPPAATGTSVMTALLTGPGVLSFTGAESEAGNFTIKVGSRAAQTIATDGSQQTVVIPAGVQLVTWSFARAVGGSAQSFASITAPSYVTVPAVAAVAPVPGAVVSAGEVTLQWSDAFAGVRAIDGATYTYHVYTGTSAGALTLLQPAVTMDADVVPLQPVTSATLAASVGPLYWRVDMTLNDGTNQVDIKGSVFNVTVASATAPTFAVTKDALQDQPWFGDLNGASLQAKMTVGLRVAIGPLPLDGGTGTVSVTVKSGTLPAGLAMTVADGAVWVKGVPTKAGAGTALLQVVRKVGSVTTAGTTLALVYTVEALPLGAYGAFNGSALYTDDTLIPKGGDTSGDHGLSSMTVTSAGKTTGKFQFAGKTYTFAADGYDVLQDNESGKIYWITNALVAVSGTNQVPIVVGVNAAWPNVASVDAASEGQSVTITGDLSRNGWADRPVDAQSQTVMQTCAGYYTSVLAGNGATNGDAFGSSYLTLTVSVNGSVKATGVLSDGTAASMSGTLLLDAVGQPYTVLFMTPSTYGGGSFFATINFILPVVEGDAVTLSGYANWRNKNPEATGVYGAGFDRVLDVQGGFYNKTLNLIDLYAGLSGFDASADTWVTPAIELGINTLGTNFTVPAAGTVDNPAYLTLSVNKVTGLFGGSFRDGTAAVYTLRSIQGVLTPAIAMDATVAGGGFFLEKTQVAAPVSYQFNQSHDFQILGCDGCSD